MSSNALLEQLDYLKPYRKDRLRVGLWVIDHPEFMSELVRYSFDPGFEKSMQALWGLEFVGRFKLELLYPHLDSFFEYLPKVSDHAFYAPYLFYVNCSLLPIIRIKTLF